MTKAAPALGLTQDVPQVLGAHEQEVQGAPQAGELGWEPLQCPTLLGPSDPWTDPHEATKVAAHPQARLGSGRRDMEMGHRGTGWVMGMGRAWEGTGVDMREGQKQRWEVWGSVGECGEAEECGCRDEAGGDRVDTGEGQRRHR